MGTGSTSFGPYCAYCASSLGKHTIALPDCCRSCIAQQKLAAAATPPSANTMVVVKQDCMPVHPPVVAYTNLSGARCSSGASFYIVPFFNSRCSSGASFYIVPFLYISLYILQFTLQQWGFLLYCAILQGDALPALQREPVYGTTHKCTQIHCTGTCSLVPAQWYKHCIARAVALVGML